MTNAPIALFVYNRPAHTRRTIEALLANAEAEDSPLYIFSDAPKTPSASQAVSEVREYIRGVSGFRTVTILERNQNMGLANSVIAGVTQLCEEYGHTIVLEDDLVVSKHFLAYMNQALELYKDQDEVMQISGHMFPVEIEIEEDAFFLPFTTSWGWATWKRAWDKFDPSAAGFAALKCDRKLRKAFDLDDAYPYFDLLKKQLKGEVDSWAIRWNLTVFMQTGLALFPKQTLVHNTGFDGTGTHCGSQEVFIANNLSTFAVKRLPQAIEVSRIASGRVYDYLRLTRVTAFTKLKNFLSNFRKRA